MKTIIKVIFDVTVASFTMFLMMMTAASGLLFTSLLLAMVTQKRMAVAFNDGHLLAELFERGKKNTNT